MLRLEGGALGGEAWQAPAEGEQPRAAGVKAWVQKRACRSWTTARRPVRREGRVVGHKARNTGESGVQSHSTLNHAVCTLSAKGNPWWVLSFNSLCSKRTTQAVVWRRCHREHRMGRTAGRRLLLWPGSEVMVAWTRRKCGGRTRARVFSEGRLVRFPNRLNTGADGEESRMIPAYSLRDRGWRRHQPRWERLQRSRFGGVAGGEL